jgi:hypothetical protein
MTAGAEPLEAAQCEASPRNQKARVCGIGNG